MHFITFLRHGESEGNSKGVIQGQLDYPLTAQGIDQANKLAVFWNSEGLSFDLIISSPLNRAAHTAEIIASCLKVPLEYDPAWKERSFGQLQGELLEQISRRTPPVDFFHPYDPIGMNGESQVELYNRACQAIQSILRLPGGAYLIVSHGGILNKALYVIMGITPQGHYNSPIFHFGNLGYAQFRYNSASKQWAVLSLNNRIKPGIEEGRDFWKID
ncbi:MAG: histidine phosphatase family protein, partial [Acidobacteriaceae bacterium]